MISPQPPSLTTIEVWKRFIRNGRLEPGFLRPEIEQAWLRCRKARVDPHAVRSIQALPKRELNSLLEKRKSLIDVARPFMGNLYQFVASSSFVVLLCDERGYILETTGDPEVIKKAPDLNFCQGALWTEEEIGNNGVGTALFLQRPFQVSGGEHYCRKHHPWTCSGAPIHDENGKMIGILEMSGPVEATHQHTLGMVVAAVEAIEQQLKVHLQNRELLLLNSHLSNLFLTVSDGVVVVDGSGSIQQINPVAEKIFGMKEKSLVGIPLSQFIDKPGPVMEMLTSSQPFNDLEVHVSGRSGVANCLATAKAIKDDHGHVTSGVVFLNPIHRLNKLINRFSGAHASFTFDDIIGRGKAISRAVQMGSQAAHSDSNVLLSGESGTGKEMFAQAIHNQSGRRQGPFIAINCGAIPRELIGSELFGYVEGAFTGASKGGRPGKFELASGGTIFLDEIGDMPLEQQASLLRVLQDLAIMRIGGDKVIHIDVRIICATNKNLTTEIARGNFRQDLYYRLNVISIALPPLRDHREDIPAMFRIFHERICSKLGTEMVPVDPEVIDRLERYDWPGNVREFQNVVEKMVNYCHQQRIAVDCLPEEILLPLSHSHAPALHAPASHREHRAQIKRAMAEEERREILDLMTQHGGNLSRVARTLGLSRTSLYRKLGKHPSASRDMD
jgi:sigma-54 dependent transcriptional regulator, acetoin dehydrogenase operon transcriptional activator AcoR